MSFGKPRETRSYTWRPALLRMGKMGTIQLSPRASLAQPSFFSKVERTPAAGHAAAAAHRGGAPDVGLRSSSPGVRARGADVRVVRRLPELDGVGGRVQPRDARRASPSHTDVSPTASGSRAAPDARRHHHSARGATVHPRGRRRARQSRSARRARRAHPRRAESSAHRRAARRRLFRLSLSLSRVVPPGVPADDRRGKFSVVSTRRPRGRGTRVPSRPALAELRLLRTVHVHPPVGLLLRPHVAATPGTNVPVPAPGTNVPVSAPALVPASRGGVRRASRRLLVCGEPRRRGPVRVLRIRRRRVDVLLRQRLRRIRRLLRRRRGMLRGSAIVGDAKGRGRTRVDRT